MSSAGRPTVLALTALVLVGVAVGPVAASPQPSPVCPVCGHDYSSMWSEDRWSAPDDRRLTVTAHANGSATWVADLRWDEPADAPTPDEETAVDRAAREALEDSLYLPDHDAVAVAVRNGGNVTIRWRTLGVVTDRVGHGVFRAFHGEGTELRLVTNVDELVVRAPGGRVITNDPAVGTLGEDATALTVDDSGRELDDFYVVFGEERRASSTATTELAIGSLIWPVAGENLFRLLLFPTVVFTVGLAGLYGAGRWWGADPDRTVNYGVYGLAVGMLVVLFDAADLFLFGLWFSAWAVLLALAALSAFGYAAATGDRRLLAASAAAVPVVGLAPLVADAWPAVQVHGLYFMATNVAYTGLAIVIVVLGLPCFLFGMGLRERRAAP